MNQFKVHVTLSFTGTIDVNATNPNQARENVMKHVGLCLGGNIHTSLSDNEIPNWNFSTHCEKEIHKIEKQ